MESIDLYFFAFHKSRFNSFHPSVSYSYLLQTLPYFNHSDHSHCGCFLFLPSKPTCPMEVLLDQRTKMRHADYNIWLLILSHGHQMGRKLNLKWMLSSKCCNLKLKSRWRMMENNEKNSHNSSHVRWRPWTIQIGIEIQWPLWHPYAIATEPGHSNDCAWKQGGPLAFQACFAADVSACLERTWDANASKLFSMKAWKRFKKTPEGVAATRIILDSVSCAFHRLVHMRFMSLVVSGTLVGTICGPCNAPVRTHIDYRHHQ